MWLLVLIFGAIGFLVLAPINIWAGWGSALVTAIITALALLGTSSDITVTDKILQVGRASIEREYVGEVTGYRGDLAFEQRGRKLHGLAYLNLRGWISPVVRIQITDERDRTPYWLTSTRHPEKLVEALGGVMALPALSETDAEETPEWLREAQQDSVSKDFI